MSSEQKSKEPRLAWSDEPGHVIISPTELYSQGMDVDSATKLSHQLLNAIAQAKKLDPFLT